MPKIYIEERHAKSLISLLVKLDMIEFYITQILQNKNIVKPNIIDSDIRINVPEKYSRRFTQWFENLEKAAKKFDISDKPQILKDAYLIRKITHHKSEIIAKRHIYRKFLEYKLAERLNILYHRHGKEVEIRLLNTVMDYRKQLYYLSFKSSFTKAVYFPSDSEIIKRRIFNDYLTQDLYSLKQKQYLKNPFSIVKLIEDLKAFRPNKNSESEYIKPGEIRFHNLSHTIKRISILLNTPQNKIPSCEYIWKTKPPVIVIRHFFDMMKYINENNGRVFEINNRKTYIIVKDVIDTLTPNGEKQIWVSPHMEYVEYSKIFPKFHPHHNRKRDSIDHIYPSSLAQMEKFEFVRLISVNEKVNNLHGGFFERKQSELYKKRTKKIVHYPFKIAHSIQLQKLRGELPYAPLKKIELIELVEQYVDGSLSDEEFSEIIQSNYSDFLGINENYSKAFWKKLCKKHGLSFNTGLKLNTNNIDLHNAIDIETDEWIFRVVRENPHDRNSRIKYYEIIKKKKILKPKEIYRFDPADRKTAEKLYEDLKKIKKIETDLKSRPFNLQKPKRKNIEGIFGFHLYPEDYEAPKKKKLILLDTKRGLNIAIKKSLNLPYNEPSKKKGAVEKQQNQTPQLGKANTDRTVITIIFGGRVVKKTYERLKVNKPKLPPKGFGNQRPPIRIYRSFSPTAPRFLAPFREVKLIGSGGNSQSKYVRK